MKKRSRSLRTHFLALYVMLAILCGIVVPALGAWFSLRTLRTYQERRFQDDIDALKDSLIALYNEEGKWNHERIRYILRPTPPWGGMIITLSDASGSEIYTLKPRNHNRNRRINPENNTQILKFALKNQNYNHTIGFLELNFRKPSGRLEREFVSYLTRYTLIGAVIMIIVACGLGFVVAGSLSRPVIKAIERTKRISHGDYDYDSREKIESGIVELDDLSRCVEDLGRSLAAQENLRHRLMTDIAHELRTPLTVTRTQLEAIADGVWEATPERLNLCVNEIERLGSLIEDVENLARLEGEVINLKFERTDMREFLQTAIDSFTALFERSGINLHGNLENAIFCEIDREKFRQVIDNLLSNAQRYTNPGGEVSVKLSRAKSGAIIEVRDTGIGISEKDLPNIFERFYRADESRARVTGGRGVGLALVKATVEAHAGKISVESIKGAGSCFRITLPLA